MRRVMPVPVANPYRAVVAAVVSLFALVFAVDAPAASGESDPRLRYQLLSIAAEAGRACAWVEPRFEGRVLRKRERLAQKMIARDLTDASDLAVIRRRAREIFAAEGCQSEAISDLVATVRAAEAE
jgi:hypothetical protein